MREKVTIIGTLNMELNLGGIKELPPWGKQAHGENCHLTAAGSAPRTAFPLSRLGAKSYLIGKVGDDVYGKEILKAVGAHGLSTLAIEKQDDLETGLCVSLVREDGERSLVTFLGSVRATTEELIQHHYELIEKTAFLLITGYFNLPGVKREAWKRILQKAKTQGKHTLLDPGWAVEGWEEGQREEILALLPSVDTFLPNREEAQALSGRNSVEEMARYLQEAGAGEVIIKLGPEGSAAYSEEEGFVREKALSVKVVDATAAGEALNAGMIWGLLQGWKLAKRLRFANLLAGLFISNPERKYPDLEEIEQERRR